MDSIKLAKHATIGGQRRREGYTWHIWNEEADARFPEMARACNVPGAEPILERFREHGGIIYCAQFMELLRKHSDEREEPEKAGGLVDSPKRARDRLSQFLS